MTRHTGPTLGHILEALTSYRPTDEEPAVSSFVVNSREAVRDSVFIAFQGEKVDGHDYVADAFARGAMVAIVQRPIARSGAGEWATIDARAGEVVFPDRLPVCILVDDTMHALQQIARNWRAKFDTCLLYTSPSPRDRTRSRMPSSA